MISDRDDFIIAIRSAFLQKGTQQRFSLLVLILFSLMLLVLGSLNFKAIDYIKIGVKEIVYKSSFIVSGPENFLKNTYVKTNDHFIFYKEYEKNKLELEFLKSKSLLNEFAILENNRLKSIIDDYLIISDEIIAKILIDKQSPFSRSVIANKGSKHNVILGMAVLEGQYLVGKIVEVNLLTSRILLLSDLNSKIPVSIEPQGIQSILSGTGKDDAIIQYFKSDNIIESDAVVYTSGSGGLFKAGIPIGKIKNLNKKKRVSLFSDFTQLRFVKILSYEEARIKAEVKAKLKDEKKAKIKAEELRIAVEKATKVEKARVKAEKQQKWRKQE
jgi:rod shape-determining protein MreC